MLNGWAISGITTFQTGFPIRITSSADNELMYSFDFELPGQPDSGRALSDVAKRQLRSQVRKLLLQRPTDPTRPIFDQNSTILRSGRSATPPRTICCGPGISQTDFRSLKTIPIIETRHFEFRAEIFNVFNHTQFFNPDGNSTDGSQFGQVTAGGAIRVWCSLL